MKKVLIPINTGLGNAVLLFPLIRTIKSIKPEAMIDLFGTNKYGVNDLFKFDEAINEIYSEVPKKKYDLILNPFLGGGWLFAVKMRLNNIFSTVISHNIEGNSFKIFIKKVIFLVLGIKVVKVNNSKHESWNYLNLMTAIHSLEIDNQQFSNLISNNTIERNYENIKLFNLPNEFIAVQLGVANNDLNPKLWPVQNWKDVINELVRDNVSVVLLGDKNEVELGRQLEEISSEKIINLIGKTSILDLISILNKANLTIGVDSGIAHISGALNKKTLVLWGPSIFTKSHPLGQNVKYINLKKSCAPCMGPNLYTPEEAVNNCNFELACMNQITPKKVMEEVRKMLSDD